MNNITPNTNLKVTLELRPTEIRMISSVLKIYSKYRGTWLETKWRKAICTTISNQNY